MRILITGGKGMLGRTLCRVLANHTLTVSDLPETDITRPAAFDAAVQAAKPELILHAAAMTAVDACESDPDQAFRVNALGSACVARAAARAGARLIAFSTDYVFDGRLPRPYHEWDATDPQSVYGASKKAGETAVQTLCPNHLIIRIAWLYGPGGPSFLHTMRRLAATPGAPLRVVRDQVGNPTSTDAVAGLVRQLIDQPLIGGILHGSCEGDASWYEFAQAIFRRFPAARALEPCTHEAFPRPAPRPANSRLEKRMLRLLGLPPMPDWREALDRFCHDHPDL